MRKKGKVLSHENSGSEAQARFKEKGFFLELSAPVAWLQLTGGREQAAPWSREASFY